MTPRVAPGREHKVNAIRTLILAFGGSLPCCLSTAIAVPSVPAKILFERLAVKAPPRIFNKNEFIVAVIQRTVNPFDYISASPRRSVAADTCNGHIKSPLTENCRFIPTD